MEDSTGKVIFTGDTLFHGGGFNMTEKWIGSPLIIQCVGCGRFFEGTAAEMHTALNKTLAAVPDDTKVYVSAFHTHLECIAHIE
jgi:hydroxyacylglutathione hydrolase